jgi:hypothetical protein
MVAAQQAAGEASKAAVQATTKAQRSEPRALAKRNGEGDGSSLSSGMLQRLWGRILELAQDCSGGGAPPSPAGGWGRAPSPSSPNP